MNDNTELTINMPTPTAEQPLVSKAPSKFSNFVPPPIETIVDAEQQKDQEDFSWETTVPYLTMEVEKPETEEIDKPDNLSKNEPDKAKPKPTEDEAEDKLETLHRQVQDLAEEAGVELKEDDKDQSDEWLETFDKIEFTIDLKAMLKRALLILMRAIFLLIINPNEKITGKDLGLPEEAPDDTSNELEREELGSKYKSWKQVLKAINNYEVKGTVMEVAGFALAANEKAVPMKVKEKDKEKKRKKTLKKMLDKLFGKDKKTTAAPKTAAIPQRRILPKFA